MPFQSLLALHFSFPDRESYLALESDASNSLFSSYRAVSQNKSNLIEPQQFPATMSQTFNAPRPRSITDKDQAPKNPNSQEFSKTEADTLIHIENTLDARTCAPQESILNSQALQAPFPHVARRLKQPKRSVLPTQGQLGLVLPVERKNFVIYNSLCDSSAMNAVKRVRARRTCLTKWKDVVRDSMAVTGFLFQPELDDTTASVWTDSSGIRRNYQMPPYCITDMAEPRDNMRQYARTARPELIEELLVNANPIVRKTFKEVERYCIASNVNASPKLSLEPYPTRILEQFSHRGTIVVFSDSYH
ncbi:hypothetical protein NHQ30_008840 [Ciborinia camelliae]|nr:hypothetical protein NHQ30_008840 [Ciborinia camelliae]